MSKKRVFISSRIEGMQDFREAAIRAIESAGMEPIHFSTLKEYQMATMTEEYQEKFLAKTRYGYLTTLGSDGSPRTVPVWFNWDGHTVRIFTGIDSYKAKRIKQNPLVTLLVSNDLSEHEAWVSFDGTAKIRLDGGIELAEQLAKKYWDLSDSSRKATLDSWKTESEHLCIIELVPERIRTYFD